MDHFRVLRSLGRGGMGEVFLARDTRLGRKVAIKVLRSDTLGSQMAVERFLQEARTTARFSHPNIVTIHHVGEVDGHPYLALEYLEGRTLRDRLLLDPPGHQETVRIGLAIAESLAEAHLHGVLHRDLKPENVMLPLDGRLRVLDFGLAKALDATVGSRDNLDLLPSTDEDPLSADRSTVETAQDGPRGSPAYMAPEQWRQEEATAATDLWALGMVLYEMVHGRHPYAGHDVMRICHHVGGEGTPPVVEAAIPERLAELIRQCLAKDPNGRPTAEQAVETLRGLLPGARHEVDDDLPPFRGLLPFDERHAGRFHGREAEIASFLERLREHPVIPVIGPSGAGKSSFVQAGVIPRLLEQGRWTVLRVRPGRQPLRALAARLLASKGRRSARTLSGLPAGGAVLRSGKLPPPRFDDRFEAQLDETERSLADELAHSPARLALRLLDLAEREDRPGPVLLFVDQLEELYTQVGVDVLRRTFLEAICTAADDPQGPVRVVFTVRADFLGRLTEVPAARDALTHVTVLGTPGADELREILTAPVAAAGYRYDDPSLVDEMVQAVAGETAALPLLQFAGEMLWTRRDATRRLLRRADYDEMGGVEGALAHHADGLLEGLSADQLRVARTLLLRMITADGTRRALPYAELPRERMEESTRVLDRLVQGRLLVVRERRAEGGSTAGTAAAEFELVHESLIRNWSRLARWIDESREERAFVAEVTQAAELWARRGRRSEELWQGDALHDAWRDNERLAAALPGRALEFLEAARRLERRRGQRRRTFVAAAVVASLLVAVLTSGLAWRAWRQEQRAVEQQQQAEIGRAVAEREAARAALTQGETLQARARLRSSLEALDSVAARALWWRLRAEPLRWLAELSGSPGSLAIAPDGAWLAAGAADGTIHVFNPETAEPTILRGHQHIVRSLTSAAGGQRLIAGTDQGVIGIWDIAQGTSIAMHDAHRSYIVALTTDDAGARAASASWDGGIRVWDPMAGTRIAGMDTGGSAVLGLALSPDGAHVAAGSADGLVRLWDAATGELVATLAGHEAQIHGLAFSADGRQLASASWDGTARVWDVARGETVHVLRGHRGRLFDVAFRPGAEELATSGDDGTVRWWDGQSGEQLALWSGHGRRDPRMEFAADGRLLAARGDDRTLRVYDLDRDGEARVLPGHVAAIMALRFLPDGRRVVTGDFERGLRLWRIDPDRAPPPEHGHSALVASVDVSPDGRQLVSASVDRSIRLWDTATGEERAHLGDLDDVAMVARFDANGDRVAAAGIDGRVIVWDVETRELLVELVGHVGPIHDLTFHPTDGSLMTASADRTVRIWDVENGRTTAVLRGHEQYLVGLGLAPDARSLLTTGADGSLGLWRADPWRLAALRQPSTMALWGVAFLDDQRFVVGGDDETLHLGSLARAEMETWALPTRTMYPDVHPDGVHVGVPLGSGEAWIVGDDDTVRLRGHRAAVNMLAFTPDGETALTVSDDGTVRAWDAASGAPRWHTAGLLPDPPELWSHQGWQRVDPDAPDVPPARTAWRDRVASGSPLLASAAGREHLCLVAADGALEIWSPGEDRLVAAWPGASTIELAATPDGCWSRADDGTVTRHPLAGEPQILASGAHALTVGGQGGAIAVDREVWLVDADGEVVRRLPTDVGVTAVGLAGDVVAVGYREGSVELRRDRDGAPSAIPLHDVPASPAVRLIPGPDGTLVAGFADGTFGLWSAEDGGRLLHAKLHGAARHLLLEGSSLYAATELGDHARLDLDVLAEDYCTLLRALWEEVPVVWVGGRAVPARPDPTHLCAE